MEKVFEDKHRELIKETEETFFKVLKQTTSGIHSAYTDDRANIFQDNMIEIRNSFQRLISYQKAILVFFNQKPD